jgi:L-alanine-DL-glutamate epimerase-like enolase superfamily enzyme
VSIAAAVQWASSLSNFYIFEHMYTENPLRTEILKVPVLECHDAVIKVPSGPGLGIEIDEGRMKRYIKT